MPKNKITPLTFGVEFEFIIKSLPLPVRVGNRRVINAIVPESTDKRPLTWSTPTGRAAQKADVYLELRKAFADYGIPCDVKAGTGFTGDYSKWDVKSDNTVQMDTEDVSNLYDYSDVEVTTPIYYNTSEKEMGSDEIRKALSVIRNNFQVHVPNSAGLHIHVGNESSGFSLSILKNVLFILYVFDKQIQVIHPNRQYIPNRSTAVGYDGYYSAPERSNLKQYLSGEKNNYLKDALDFLYIKPDLVEKIDRVSDEITSNNPVEYSQAKRFLNGEQKMEQNHIRIRQHFATGPESMAGLGATNIPDEKPGSVAQRFFRGPQISTHLAKHLTQPLDPQLQTLLLTPNSTLPPLPHHPDPTTLLAPVLLSQAENIKNLHTLNKGSMAERSANSIWGFATKPGTGTLKTIEFRQHQGSLDADKVLAWVRMLTGIVEWARSVSPVKLVELLRIGGEKSEEEFDLVDLLRYMGLDESADYYERVFFEVR